MPDPPRRPPLPNPFYVAVVLSSTVFVVTALMYLVSPLVLQRQGGAVGPAPTGMVGWLDRQGPRALGGEFLAMLVSGALAMLTDPWFRGPTRGPSERGRP